MNKQKTYKILLWFFSTVLVLMIITSITVYTLKDKIIQYVVTEINKELNVKVKVDKIDLTFWFTFPKVAVDFNNVLVYDSFSNDSLNIQDTLLRSEQIRLKFNAMDLWNGKYEVQEINVKPGIVKLKIDKDGNENFKFLKDKEETADTSEFKLDLKNVGLNEIRFSYENFAINQFYYAFINDLNLNGSFSDKEFLLEAKSDLQINKVQHEKIVLVKNIPTDFNLNLLVNPETGSVLVNETTINLARLPFKLSAVYSTEEFGLKLKSDNLNLSQLIQKINIEQMEILKKLKSTGFLDFNLDFHSNLQKTEAPTIICDFKLQNGSLIEPTQNIKVEKINVIGSFHSSKDKQSDKLKIEKLQFNSVGTGFNGNLTITNFQQPFIHSQGNGTINLGLFQRIFNLKKFEDLSGIIDLNGQFQLVSSENSIDLKKCDANINLKNINIKMKGDYNVYRNINGNLIANTNQVRFNNFSINTKTSDFRIDGFLNNVYSYLKNSDKLIGEFSVVSNYFNIDDFTSESTESIATKDDLVFKTYLFPDYIDSKIKVDIQKLKVGDQQFQNLRGLFAYSNRVIHCDQLSVTNSDANVVANVRIAEQSPEKLTIYTRARVEQIDLNKFFKNWKNFDQDMITDKNISGLAKIDLTFNAIFDVNEGIDKKSIISSIDLNLLDGRLKNVETFKSIGENLRKSNAKLAFKKQDLNELESKLNDIRFSELSNTILIKDQKITIPKMIIKSSLLDINIQGTQTFANYLDYHFDFKLRDLKSQQVTSEFGETVMDGTGVRLFLHLFGNTEDLGFRWDKEASKLQQKENVQKATSEAKSILKTEFGIGKKDSTIQKYVPVKKEKEEVKISFDTENESLSTKEEKKPSKIQEKLNKLKQEQNKPKEEFSFE